MHANRLVHWLSLSCLCLALTGCIGGSSPPSQFYLLEPINEGPGMSGVSARPLVALGPVRIPRYLDRPQIVTATAQNAYQLSEVNRWAESLDDNVSRVLAQNLPLLVPVEVVPIKASNRATQARFRVSVTILEFHVNPASQAVLTAQWQIARGLDPILSRQASYRSPASTNDYPVMVAALNDCVNRMSRDLAKSLHQFLKE
ncbi:MAG: PqiC family protein [Gammaproteobacteria bacterium]